jgi:hypothetical protein
VEKPGAQDASGEKPSNSTTFPLLTHFARPSPQPRAHAQPNLFRPLACAEFFRAFGLDAEDAEDAAVEADVEAFVVDAEDAAGRSEPSAKGSL